MITPPWFNDPTEVLAFNCYASHISRIEDAIEECAVWGVQPSEAEFTFSEIEYILREAKKRG